MSSSKQPPRDDGNILPMVLVISVVLSLVVVGLATYISTTLRFGQVVEEAADRVAAADGGIDYALDNLRLQRTLCATALGDSGLNQTFPGTINGLNPVISCRRVGGDISAVDAFAVVMTGAGGATRPLLEVSGGGQSDNSDKTFTGPIFMERLTWQFQSDLTLDDGDLWYRDSTCPDSSFAWNLSEDDGAPAKPAALTITPDYRTMICVQESWEDIFLQRKPPEPSLSGPLNPPKSIDASGCHIWSPGRYTTAPDIANQSYNYFISGNYYFDNVGEIATKNAYLLAGYPGTSGPSIVQIKPQDTAQNHPCRFAWADDHGGDRGGATFYLGGDSTIYVGGNSALEVSGRVQGNARVSIQALEGAGASTIRGDDAIVTTKSGNGSQLSMKGLVWAPYASFRFDNIANKTVAALEGGAYVATLSAGAAANTNNFLIEVETQPARARMVITSTATNSGSTSVRALVDYRMSDGATAVISRRVRNLTPE